MIPSLPAASPRRLARRDSVGHKGVTIVGLAGIEEALWDLRGKAAGLNVSRLIGACRTAVPVYHSGGLWFDRALDELQREAASFVARAGAP